MSIFVRRFTVDPGNDTLTEIEAVDVLDLDPPASITGVGAGTVLMVGEFENGPFNSPGEVTGASDLLTTWGSLGYEQGGTKGNNPCARSRLADGAIAAETWNGNGAVQLTGKKYKRLHLVRVDTSVGSVQLSCLASVTGAAAFRYALATGQTIIIDTGGGLTTLTATAAAATITSGAQTFPTLFVGGETLTLGFDDSTAHPNITVTFLAADQTQAQVIARINAYFGFTFAASVTGTTMSLTGRIKGTSGQVRVVSASGGVAATLGLSIANTPGTGTIGATNIADVSAVTPTELKTAIEAGIANSLVDFLSDGRIRIASTSTAIGVGAGTANTALGLVAAASVLATTFVPTAGKIPAGTVVTKTVVAALTTFVTMQDIVFATSGVMVGGLPVTTAGPYNVKVRHATDDGTGTSAVAGTLTKISTPNDLVALSVANAQTVTAALSEAAIDAAYLTAMNSTLDPSAISREANIIISARQSNAIRRALRQNALDASANGLFGRMAIVRPPLGTTKALSKSTSSEPGVGATRDQRVVCVWPGVNIYVPIIAARGTAGGTGFTVDGNVDMGADAMLASVMSQLNPEENPGQETVFTGSVNSLDTQAIAQGVLTMADYILFKKAGICAVRMDDGTCVFQSGVTSVDPVANPQFVRISRRRMADYIEDSMARRAKSFGKKLSTNARRKALAAELRQFLKDLLSENNAASQRIAGFTVDDKTGNTPELLAKGIFRIIINVRTLASLDFIVLACTVGESVEVVEQLPQAA